MLLAFNCLNLGRKLDSRSGLDFETFTETNVLERGTYLSINRYMGFPQIIDNQCDKVIAAILFAKVRFPILIRL